MSARPPPGAPWAPRLRGGSSRVVRILVGELRAQARHDLGPDLGPDGAHVERCLDAAERRMMGQALAGKIPFLTSRLLAWAVSILQEEMASLRPAPAAALGGFGSASADRGGPPAGHLRPTSHARGGNRVVMPEHHR